MATDGFRRRTRASVDVALHRVHQSLSPHSRGVLSRLLAVVRARSDLMHRVPARDGTLVQVTALTNCARFEHDFVRDPEGWAGASGHPIAVAHSLASHLFGTYAVPRFLASAFFGTEDTRIRAVIAHARGQSVRRLTLPIAFTRAMAHHFLCTPDHISFDRAMRRAEVLGLGGSPRLADVISATVLGQRFTDGDAWRNALSWLARRDDVDLEQLGPLVDYLAAHLHAIELRGRTFASAMRLVADWHALLATQRRGAFSWPRSRWREMTVRVPGKDRDAEWTIVELLDTRELTREGRAMRHCVAAYAATCRAGHSHIFSLRRRWCDDDAVHSVVTIQVLPRLGEIVQIRGSANSRPGVEAMSLVQRWAAREGLLGL